MRRIVALWLVVVALVAPLVWPKDARAFCGFYVSGADGKLFNNASQVVLMRQGIRTVLSMQNNYQGPPQNFAMVVPVPVVLQKENVKTLPRDIFDRVDKLAAPRLVEYWEQDPCQPQMRYETPLMAAAPPRAMARSAPAADLGVKIEAQFTVGEYEVLILSASDSNGLDTWLRRERYSIPDGAEPILRPYVQSGMKFFVAKVDAAKVKFENGMATLSPLRFHYDSEKFALPIRLGLVNSPGTQDLIVHILARGQRYDVANYQNVTIPTNFDVDEKARGQFPTFYAALFDRTLETTPKAVVTEYAWDAGSCDPCPTPALTMNELATLGDDVIGAAVTTGDAGAGIVTPLGSSSARGPQGIMPSMPIRRPPPWGGRGGGFVLTRLHARYGKDTVGDDLVFKAAEPIVGGREFRQDGKLEHGAQTNSGVNNFQGRYAIRHPWTGPVACENPVRGQWGGPPSGTEGDMKPLAAQNTAFAPRGSVQLASFVKSDVPELSLTPGAAQAPVPAPMPGTAASGPTPTPAPPSKGCAGCTVSAAQNGVAAGSFAGLLGIALLARRRRR